nr:MAG TPA: Transcriptional regulator, RHH-like, CopG [Inoviridae sp.]
MNKKINKRVSVGFSEEEYRVLRELSEQNGQPMAKIVSELVSTVIPILKQMTENLKIVNNMPAVVREGFRDSVESAFDEIHSVSALTPQDGLS